MYIDYHPRKSGAAQLAQLVFQQRQPRDFDECLGAMIGERSQPSAQSGGKYHSLFHELNLLNLFDWLFDGAPQRFRS
jgi:hypothetical protein